MCGKNATALRKAGLSARVHDLAHYDSRDLLQEETVLLAISTWGEGEPPVDGISFFDYVKDLGEATLDRLRFAVFALGDTGYAGISIECLRSVGASRLLARVDNDVDFEEALACWHEAVLVAIQDTVIV
jgi:sulfite reductase (NADPH) flavoprotein alpha-component